MCNKEYKDIKPESIRIPTKQWRGGEGCGGGLTSSRGAGLCCAVDLPPAEARADLAGLMVRDPRFQELRENEV